MARNPGAPPTLRRGRGPWGRGRREVGVGGDRRPNCPQKGLLGGAGEPAGREGAGAELRGRGCCGRAGRPGCAAGAGRRRPPRLGLTKRKQPSAQPRHWGPPRGVEGGRAGTPGGARRGRGTSCLSPPAPGRSRSASKPSARRAPQPPSGSEASPPPTALTPSGCEIRGRQRLFAPQLG